PLVGLNLNQATNALALVRARIVNRVALGKGAGINAEKNQFADKWIAPKFESERAEPPIVVRRRLDLFVCVGLHANSGRDVERAWQIIDDRINEVLNAFILESRTPNYRDKSVRNRLAPNASFQQFRRNRLLFEEKHADFVVEIGDRGDQIIVRFVDNRLVFIGNVRDF